MSRRASRQEARLRSIKWTMIVLIPKVASSAIRDAVIRSREPEFTVVFIRHPWDRLVSALYSVIRSSRSLDERIQQYIDAAESAGCQLDSHLRPQVSFIDGRTIDFYGRFEYLTQDWKLLQSRCSGLADLPSKPKSNRPRWQDAKIDWDRWYPMYRRDFELWGSV